MKKRSSGWKKFNDDLGVIKNPGNSMEYRTGNWAGRKLNFCAKNCINCSLCWSVCPDDAILTDDEGNMIGVDLDHCKSCGLCTEACPTTKKPDSEDHALFFSEKTEDEN